MPATRTPLIDEADLAANTRAAWEARALAVLKGARLDNLISRTADGLPIEPLYPPVAGAPRALRSKPGRWAISQRVDHPDSTQANAQALADLAGGADALTLVTADSPAARGYGVAVNGLADLADALAGVRLDLIALRVEAGAAAPRVARLIADLVRQRRLDPAALDIGFGCDPVPLHAQGLARAAIADALAATSRALRSAGFAGGAHIADGRVWHDAGASEAQELGLAVASGIETLRMLEAQGLGLDVTAGDLCFCVAADADVFVGLAKFRALRLLWARVEAACGLTPRAIRVHAETSWRMLSKRDPHVNILRTGAAVFAAGLGGADTIAALPFTAALGLPDPAARRIARNTQLVFLEESHLGQVADPAAGAGGFEALTRQLCEAAWDFFQSIEKAGGLIAALDAGQPQAAVATVAEARAHAIATRKQPLTGTSEFTLAGEPPSAVMPSPPGKPVAPLVPARRDAEAFEALRDAADAFAARHGTRPGVFLALLGEPAAMAARANFARGVFEAGGFAVSGGGDGAGELPAAFKATGAQIACLCGADASYAALAPAAARALREAGAAMVALAGRPDGAEASPRAAGIDAFVYAGCDVVALLRDCAARIGQSKA